MCRAIFLQHSFHNIVFSSFLFFFFLSLFFSYQARFPQSRRLFRLVTSNSRSDLHFDSGGWPSWFPDIPPPLLLVCLFARSRSYLKRSFRRKPWTLRAFRVKSWTDLRINYSAHVSPGCALVCRVRTKYLSLSLSSRDSHISEDTNFISLSLSHIPFSYSSLLFTSTSYSSVFSRETRSDAIPDVITLPSNSPFPRAKFLSLLYELEFCGAISSNSARIASITIGRR